MADISIATPHGSVSVVVDLSTTRDGNKALAEATAKATKDAAAQGRKLASGYGTSRNGDNLTIIFPLAE